MKKLILALMLCLAALPVQAADFSNWAVMIIAGDNHSHSGGPSQVFDNARKDLTKAFAGIGFNPNNIVQFSVSPDKDALQVDPQAIATNLWDLTNRAPGGCLIYYTSHGTPKGIIMGNGQMQPDNWGHIVNNACGNKPAVIVMSACFSGQFVPMLAAGNRMVMTAAREDRTSFGCGDDDHYTFFDGCFLQALPQSGSFRDVALITQRCVGQLEAEMKVDYPSEPQIAYGKEVGNTLTWR
jgi:hypothetical protein